MRWVDVRIVPLDVDDGDCRPGAENRSGVVILAVYGKGVSSRAVADGDPLLGRLSGNDALAWTFYDGSVCYVPKSLLESSLEDLSGSHVAAIVVGRTREQAEASAAQRRKELATWDRVTHDAALRNAVFGDLYRRFRLPVLTFWLLILVGNFFLSARLEDRIGEANARRQQYQRQARTVMESTSQQRRLWTDFRMMSLPKSASRLDRIAALLPDGVRLTRLEPEGTSIVIGGVAEEVAAIMRFSSLLKETYPDVEIRVIDTPANAVMFHFELLVEP